MRLWHKDLIPYLPKSQLLAQWRELNSIFKKQDNHILINYVYEYSKEHLYAYTQLVIQEFKKRGFKIKNWENYNTYFSDINKNMILSYNDIFYDIHNEDYLIECYFNLKEKYKCDQKDFSILIWSAIRRMFGERVLEEVNIQLGDK